MANKGIDLLYDFSSLIEPKVRLTKDGEIIKYESTDAQNLAYVNITLPLKYLPFTENEIAFGDFTDFYNNISLVSDPSLKQNEDVIEITGKTAKSKYNLTDPSLIKRIGEGAIPARNEDYKFILTKDDIAEINKIFTVTKTKDLEIKVTQKGVKFTFTGEGLFTEHTFVRKHAVEYTGEEFAVTTNQQIFVKIPKKDYTVILDKNNLIELQMLTEGDDANEIVAYMVI